MNKNIISLNYKRNDIVVKSKFGNIQQLNQYVIDLYINGEIKRQDAVNITGLSPSNISTILHRKKQRNKDGNK